MSEQEAEKKIQVACLVPPSVNEEMKLMGRPGSICSGIVKDFYKVIKNTFSTKTPQIIDTPDGSLVYIAHNKDKILLTIKNGDNAMILDMDELTACRLVLNINSALNSEG